MKSPNQISCIIPFFNESERILSVLAIITQIPAIAQVICIDDGSTDNTAEKIRERWPDIDLVCLSKNEGKSSAIKHGLRLVRSEYVLLMDADLRFLDGREITYAIRTIQTRDAIDMLIFRRIRAPWFFKIDRRDVLFSGERILKYKDLEKILEQAVFRYQLEIAINEYMLKNNKMVRWMPWSASNTHKAKKWGIAYGFKRELMMFRDMIMYAGYIEYLRQIIIFARKKIE